MSDIYLQKAQAKDEAFVKKLTKETMQKYVNETWADTTSREDYFVQNTFNQKETQIVYKNNEAIGWISLTESETDIYIGGIHLLSSAQGQGIGKKLLSDVIEQGKGKQKSLSLMVLKVNPAKILYERLGFSVYNESIERFYMRKV